MSRSTLTNWHQATVIPLHQAPCTESDAITEDAAVQEADPVRLTTRTPTQTAVMSRQSSMMMGQQKAGSPNTRGPTGMNGQQVV